MKCILSFNGIETILKQSVVLKHDCYGASTEIAAHVNDLNSLQKPLVSSHNQLPAASCSRSTIVFPKGGRQLYEIKLNIKHCH